MGTISGPLPGRRRTSISGLTFVLAAAIVSASIGFFVATRPASEPSLQQVRADVRNALDHLVGAPESAVQIQPYVEAVDDSLAAAIAAGGAQSPSDDSGLTAAGRVSVSAMRVVSPEEVSFSFAIATGAQPSYEQRFLGDAVLSGGTWKLSWATVCMLIETESHLCPNPPTILPGAVPLPRSLTSVAMLRAEVPDLIRPEALAVEPDGDLLIVDVGRDQILRWRADGSLSIFAGTGEPGLSGVGGPATRAKLPSYFGEQLAVARNDTVYATGGSACGLLEITPSGILERLLTRLCGIAGVTLAPGGTMYVSAGPAVYRYRSGVLVEIARNAFPPEKAARRTVPTALGFWPADLAVEGNGDLDIDSDSPHAIWRLSPDGKLSDLGHYYPEAMTSAPDGSVLVAGHAGSIEDVTNAGVRPTLDLLSTTIAGYGVPGVHGGFQPDGIAVSGSGTVFVDTFAGNGWTDTTSIAEIPPRGRPVQIPITTPVLDTLPASGAPGFPPLLYPPAAAATGSDLLACPSPRGLRPFDRAAVAGARRVAAQYNAYSSSFWGDLHASDRSWWRGVVDEWTGGDDVDTHTVERAGPASADTFAPAVEGACGSQLVRDSEVVVDGPSAYSWQVTHLFLLDRDGRVLVYFQAT